jgi:homoserine dehydrogenase
MSIQNNQLNIGLFGFGVVGEGLYKVLEQSRNIDATIKKVCIKHKNKKRNAPTELFTTDANELLSDKDLNVVIELIDDAEAAYKIVKKALSDGKHVISANKKMISAHLPELLELQSKYNVSFLYEAACCASIPVIRNLEEYYDNDLLQSLSGIVNGSTNYILSKVFEENLSFQEALLQAQVEGYAESDPTLDIEGIDAVNKLSILLLHAYGVLTSTDKLVHSGITQLQPQDAKYAREKGLAIKLIAHAVKTKDNEVTAFVLPQFVKADDLLYQVKDENNAVVIQSGFSEKQFFFGKGAGSYPTASAVLSDLSALRYNYRYEYRKLNGNDIPILTNDCYLRVYVSFEGLFHVPHEAFEKIDEWNSNNERCYVTGIVRFSKLQGSNWWRKPGTSLILLPDAIVTEPVVSVKRMHDILT